MDRPSQAQTGLLKGAEGFFGGLNKQDAAKDAMDLRLKYLEAQSAAKAPYQTALEQYRQTKLAQDQAKADADRASREKIARTPKPTAAGSIPGFNTNETRRAAQSAAVKALANLGFKSLDEATPEGAKAYRDAYTNTYRDAAQQHNKRLAAKGITDAKYLANEDPGDPLSKTPDTVDKGWFWDSTKPGSYTPNPEFGLDALATAGGATAATKPKETFAQRTARLAAEAAQ